MPRLAEIWRHPVKSLGHEALERTTLTKGQCLPHDRRWAVAHGASDWNPEAPGWQPCGNFLRVTHAPALAAISARYDEAEGSLTLTHPTAEADLTIRPDTEEGAEALTAWATPLAAGARPGPYRLAHAPGIAMTDSDEQLVSIKSLSSLRALSQHMGVSADPRRFRGNLWLDGFAAWEEEHWEGRHLRIGQTLLRIDEPIGRCRATEANPKRGARDVSALDTLRTVRGHKNFGIYAEVIEGGEIAQGDPVELLK